MKTNFLLISGLFLLIFSTISKSQVNVPFHSEWKYLKGKDAAGLASDWYTTGYSDAAWSSGSAPFRYGDGSGGTLLSDMKDSYTTFYMRKSFNANNIPNLTRLVFEANFDDGFVVWLNGVEIISYNAPEELANDGVAPETVESGSISRFAVDISDLPLQLTNNIIAIQGFNAASYSSDFYMDFAWSSLPEIVLSETVAVFFNHDAGYYANPFDLTLTAPDAGYKIIYTIDGSNPAISPTGDTVASPKTIRIDPDNTTGRGKTPGYVVKASLYKAGYMPSLPQAKTFVFTDKVKTQSSPGGSWPASNINGQRIDYNMASDVINDSRYASFIDDALLEIPTLSLTTDLKNLFDPATGIYVNAGMQGKAWERECSVELINPDGSLGFQTNCGVRIRGGSSRDSGNPKHSFRLFFDFDYGESKLKFPIFGTEGVSKFRNLDLRTEQNYSWSKDGGSDGARNTFVREVFSRDSQRDENQPYTRSRYYHLYLNGMYWGLYQSEERPEAEYAESYFGDDKEDYDVIKVEPVGWPFYIAVTDGNMDSWQELYNLCKKGFTNNKDYFALQGKDENGKSIPNTRVLVDIDNLIEYMLMIFYTGDFDAPVSSWHNNDMPNNFFAIYNRKDLSQGYKIIAHDSEHSLFVVNNYSDGLYENRVNLPDMSCADVYSFQPQWLHYKLTLNAEYRNRFRDKAYRYFSDGGVFSPSIAAERFKTRADQIDMAIIAESARWGDAQISPSRTKDDDWLPEINSMYSTYFPLRTGIVIDQMKEVDLYSDYDAPVLKKAGTVLKDQVYNFTDGFTVSIENPNASGDVYYTLDGTDPRLLGGSVSEKAIMAGNQAEIAISNSTVIQARVKIGIEWSPIHEVYFFNTEEDFSNLKVTELAYHPKQEVTGTDTTDSKDFEFIEFKNIGNTSINISGLKLDSAVSYTFPENTMLPPKDFYVVASKPECFYRRYGLAPSGNFSGNLGNSGEYVLLTDRDGNKIFSFTYDDMLPWPEEADGSSSIVSVNADPTGDPNSYQYWKMSKNTNGSPFADDNAFTFDDPSVLDAYWSVYPNPANEYTQIQYNGEIHNGTISVKLYDQDGRMVYNCESKQQIININLSSKGIQPGVYIIKTSVNEYTHVEKLIFLKK
jgi:hypothetical protein